MKTTLSGTRSPIWHYSVLVALFMNSLLHPQTGNADLRQLIPSSCFLCPSVSKNPAPMIVQEEKWLTYVGCRSPSPRTGLGACIFVLISKPYLICENDNRYDCFFFCRFRDGMRHASPTSWVSRRFLVPVTQIKHGQLGTVRFLWRERGSGTQR